jgi:hypothetical protein
LQHNGLLGSKPVGLQVPPPKHRQTPLESGLQTSFFPSQQFWDAFASPAPQMLPGGLQAPPLSQRLSSVVQSTHCELAMSALMLQQDAVESQKSPVILQPATTVQTFAPVPGSSQRREQQLDGPSHGLPPWTQPPAGSMQRPTSPCD